MSNKSGNHPILPVLAIALLAMLCVGLVSASAERIGSEKPEQTTMIKGLFAVTQTDVCSGAETSDLTQGVTVNDLTDSLVGSGVTISNLVYTGNDKSAGIFSNGAGSFGIDNGIVLSSGDIRYVKGPNEADGITLNTGLPGDADLNALIPGYTTYDATILEFDFVPTSDVLQFNYVFSSDEYNEYVNSNYNDVFGFFVNGQNVALIPGTSTPVSINNVNNGNPYNTDPRSHPEFYINNDLSDGGGSICTEMDGLTKVFTATVKVNAGQVNHIKLAIADAGDHILDSNVLIEGGSFSAPDLTLEPLSESSCGNTHTVTATLTDGGQPIGGETITFTVIDGPNNGKSGEAITDNDGKASWTYTNTGGAGTDTIQATGYDKESNLAYMVWLDSCVPEFPTLALPVAMIFGFVFIAYSLRSRKEE
jgi:hypothetical protein